MQETHNHACSLEGTRSSLCEVNERQMESGVWMLYHLCEEMVCDSNGADGIALQVRQLLLQRPACNTRHILVGLTMSTGPPLNHSMALQRCCYETRENCSAAAYVFSKKPVSMYPALQKMS